MQGFSRRGWIGFMGASAATVAWAGFPGIEAAAKKSGTTTYVLPELPYKSDALEPHLDRRTLTIHHDKHHAGYVAGLNSTLAKLDQARKDNDFSRMHSLSRALAFHGSGHVLHTLYFSNLSPKPGKPKGALKRAISSQFGGQEELESHFKAATASVSGSGWGVLAYEPMGGRLLALQVEKHENQHLAGAIPIMVIDVWEHAYYLKYKNRRSEYLEAIMKVVDWSEVSERFDRVK